MPKFSKHTTLKLIKTYNNLEPLKNATSDPLLHCCLELPAYEFDLLTTYTVSRFLVIPETFDVEFARSYLAALKINPSNATRHAKIVLDVYRPPWNKIYKFSRAEYKIDRTTPLTYWYVTNYPSGWNHINSEIEDLYTYGFKSISVLKYIENLYNIIADQVTCAVSALRFTKNVKDLPYLTYPQFKIPHILFGMLLNIADVYTIVEWIKCALENITYTRHVGVCKKQLLLAANSDRVYELLNCYKIEYCPGSFYYAMRRMCVNFVQKHFSSTEYRVIKRCILDPLRL